MDSADAVRSPPGPRPQKRALLLVAVIAVVVLLVFALVLTGVIPGLHLGPGSSSTSGEALTYFAAQPLASAAAARATGGPWTLFAAEGVDVNSTIGMSSELASEVPFPTVWDYLTSDRPEIPAYHGSLSAGAAPWWLFQYGNGSTVKGGIYQNDTIVLDVIVVDGAGLAFAIEYSGSLVGGTVVSVPATGIINSPVAMAAAIASNSSFFGLHPDINATIGLGWQGNVTDPNGAPQAVWGMVFTTCTPGTQTFNATSKTYAGVELGVELNATSGALHYGYGFPAESENCSSLG